MTGKLTLGARVASLETKMTAIEKGAADMTATLVTISDGQTEILDAIKTAKTIRAFARKFVWPVVTAAATAGFLNPKVSAFLTALFA